MKNTKILALFLAMVMVLGMLSACGSEAASTAESTASAPAEASAPAQEEAPAEDPAPVEEPASTLEASVPEEAVEEPAGDPYAAMAEEYISYPLEGDNSITMWYYIPPYSQFTESNADFNCIDDAAAATGVKLIFNEVPQASASEQFNLMVASGDMSDLIPAREYYTGGLTMAYEEDIIIDINEYVAEYMPNYAGVYATLDEKTQQEALSDGMMLAFSTIADGSYSGNGFVTRGDWIEELGIEWSGNLISLDEFTDYLRAIHDAYEVPYTYYLYDGTIALEAAFDTEIPVLVSDGFMTFVTSAIYREGNTIKSGWITDGYREYLEWVREMMAEGIIYEDFLSLDSDRMVQNQMQGTGEIGVWTANADKLEECAVYNETDDNYAVAAVPNVTKDPSQPYVWLQDMSLVTSNSGFSISSTCEQPELVCQWQNYFWTTDGWYMANYGIEGESYHMEGDTAIFDWDQPTTATGQTAPNAEMAQQLWTMMRFVTFFSDHDRLLPTFPESALNAIETWTFEGTDDRFYPTSLEQGFTVEENEAIAEYEADMLTYAEETCLEFLTGAAELNDDSWNAYVATMEDMGINEIIAVYQNAYDEYIAGER